MTYYFEVGLCLASTYLGMKACQNPNPPPDKILKSQQGTSAFLGILLPIWKVLVPVSCLSQAYFLFNNPDAAIPWRAHFNIGFGLIVLGGLIRMWCYRTLGRFYTFQVGVSEGQKVIQSGPYGLVRHPSYTATLGLMIGFCFCIIGPLNILCILLPTQPLDLGLHEYSVPNPSIKDVVRTGLGLFSTYTYIAYFKDWINRIPDEEDMMVKELGDSYKAYQKKVPYKLIPFVW